VTYIPPPRFKSGSMQRPKGAPDEKSRTWGADAGKHPGGCRAPSERVNRLIAQHVATAVMHPTIYSENFDGRPKAGRIKMAAEAK
jgi:hypothetical protein